MFFVCIYAHILFIYINCFVCVIPYALYNARLVLVLSSSPHLDREKQTRDEGESKYNATHSLSLNQQQNFICTPHKYSISISKEGGKDLPDSP